MPIRKSISVDILTFSSLPKDSLRMSFENKNVRIWYSAYSADFWTILRFALPAG
jgi:hypothetical protein